MSIFHRREPKRFVFARVFFVPDADESALEQLHDRCQDFVSRQSRRFQIPRDSPADLRQRFAETNYAVVFVFVANLAPALVIKVLFATARVATGCLNVTVGRGTNPHVSPSRRNRQAFDPQKPLFVTNELSVGVEPREIFAFGFTRVARPIVANITQPGLFGCVHCLSNDLRAVAISIFRTRGHVIEFAGGAVNRPYLRAVALGEFFLRLRFGRWRDWWLLRRLGRLVRRRLGEGGCFCLWLGRRSFRLRCTFRGLLGNFDIDHLQIRERIAEHGRFVVRQITPRFFLNHRQLIDKHFRELEIHFALAGFRVRNLPEKQRRVLRVHHNELDEALRKFPALNASLSFASHIYFYFATGELSGLPAVALAEVGGRTVAKTYGWSRKYFAATRLISSMETASTSCSSFL